MFSKPIDVLAIGDIVTDAFIKLKEAHVNCNVNNVGCEICMKFGDKVPFESVTELRAVGNSPNASVSASRLGLRSSLLASVGNDRDGQECLAELKRNGVGVKHVQVYPGFKTNYHYVLWYDVDRTILVNHTEFPYSFPRLPKAPRWIYLSSLASNSFEYHLEILAYLKQNPEVKLCFQPGTFQMKLGTAKLAELYKRADVFVCNVEESQRILGLEEKGFTNITDIKNLLSGIAALGPKIVLITDGPKGAYMLEGGISYFMPIYPDPKPPVERTGCGDAFASTFISALCLGKTSLEALVWAPINPMWVVQFVGAQKGLMSQGELEGWLAKAPTNYRYNVI